MLKYHKYFYTLSLAITVIGIASLLLFGLRFGTDFVGGSSMEVEFSVARPSDQAITEKLSTLDLGDVSLRSSGSKSVIMRFKSVDEPTHQAIIKHLKEVQQPGAGPDPSTGSSQPGSGQAGQAATIVESQFDSIGPAIGKETQRRSMYAVVLVILTIALYVTWAFRKVSYPLGSSKYGIITIITLFHDVIITVGIFSILGHFFAIEVGVPFIAALLTVLGYSVNDTIVVFDRIRENLARQRAQFSFAEIVDASMRETVVRSLNTSITAFVALCAVLIFGGESVRYFILTLAIGVIAGTYSSIWIASPLLVTWHDFIRKTDYR